MANDLLSILIVMLTSFLFTVLISVPFIAFLYKFNIRRLTEVNLDEILPGRSNVKLGTPIMGGTVILTTTLLFALFLLNSWEYFPLIVLVILLGGITGAVDEYTNALGKTLFAIRKSKSTGKKSFHFIAKSSSLYKVKSLLLVPWKMFEEAIRVMGSNQRGIKGSYKFLMHTGLALLIIVFLILNNRGTYTDVPFIGNVELGFVYYIFIFFILTSFVNAFGITDGMDGLSAGTHSIAFAAYGILAYSFGLKELGMLAFIVTGAELAFLYFNIKPARMQMSDVGTVPLGLLFALAGILMYRELSLPLIGAVFVIELLSSVGQQWSVKLRKKRILLVAPIHHHFEKLGWSENKIVERFWLFGVISAICGMIFALL